MNIAVLSAANSSHTVKIVNSLALRGHQITLYSLPEHRDEDGEIDPRVSIVYLPHQSYSKDHKILRQQLVQSGAQVLYAHYATGYGLLSRKTKFQPTVLAVWGSDVYEFPYKSPVHRYLLKKNLAFPKVIFSTSHAMARQTKQFTRKPMVITPFGVDVDAFCPCEETREEDTIRFGYLKTIAPVYGTKDLIHAFGLLTQRLPNLSLRLDLYGGGEQLEEMKGLATDLGLSESVTFHGRLPHEQAPAVLRQMDVLCVPSLRESFGVSAVEAMACGIPCIVSMADGLQEVTVDGVTGLSVPCGDANALCDAMEKLALDADLRHQMGKAGRQHVLEQYDWQKNVTIIEQALQDALSK